MESTSIHYEYDPLYLLSERLIALTSLPEEQRDEKEISKIEETLQREAPHYLYNEGENFKTI